MSQQPWGNQQQYPPQQQQWGPPPQQYGPPQTNGWSNPPQQQQGSWRGQAQPQQPQRSANDILMGGGGPAAWKFPEPGVRKVAKVAKPPTSRQETEFDVRNPGTPGPGKVYPSGDPIMMVMVEVATDERDYQTDPEDDGRRTFYIQGRRLRDAVRDAVRNAGANGLEVGGVLDVTLVSYDVPNERKSGCNWQITYTSAANAALGATPPQRPAQQQQPQQQWQQPTNPTQVAGPPPDWSTVQGQTPTATPTTTSSSNVGIDEAMTGGTSGWSDAQQAAYEAWQQGQ
jgi:hypothetical protein